MKVAIGFSLGVWLVATAEMLIEREAAAPATRIDWTQVLIIAIPSVMTGLVTVVLALITLKTQAIAREAKVVAEQTKSVAEKGVEQAVETHKSVNSRMDEMLRLVRDKSLAEGRIAGQETERATNLTEQVAKTAALTAKTVETIAEKTMSKDPQEVVVVKPAEVIVIKAPDESPPTTPTG